MKCSFQGSRVKTVRRNSLVPRCLPWACQRRLPITSPDMLDFMEELLGMCRGRCPHRPAETVSVHLRSAASRAVVSKPFGGIRSFLAVCLGLVYTASLEKGDSPRGGEMPAGQRGPLSTRGTAVRRWRDFPVKCSFQGSRVETVRRNSLVPRCPPGACQRRWLTLPVSVMLIFRFFPVKAGNFMKYGVCKLVYKAPL